MSLVGENAVIEQSLYTCSATTKAIHLKISFCNVPGVYLTLE